MKYRLNDKQLELLKKVAAVPKAFDATGAHSGVLWALRQRTLVTTSWATGRQVVTLTADGRFYLKHGKHPKEVEEEKQRLKNDPAQAALAPADGPELLTRIRESNGTITVPGPGPKTRARWRAAYYHALHHGHVPEDCKLRFNGRDKGDVIIRLLDEAALKAAEPPVIPAIEVPDQLPTKPHALITRTLKALGRSKTTVDTRDRADVVPVHVSRHLADRALRIAHVLITEAERRGYEVTTVTSHHRGEETHQLVVRIGIHEYPWEIAERTAKVPHEPTPQELRDHEKHPWNRIPKYDHNPNGQLMIASPHRDAYYRPSYSHADGARWVLEDRLGHFLRDLEERTERAEEQRLAAEQAEAARKRNWYSTLRQAREAQITQHRSVIIAEQATNWRLAQDIRAFCAAARQADSAADWVQWAEQYATAIDPLARSLTAPADPPATQQALQEYFGRDTYAHAWPFDKTGQWTLAADTTQAADG
ncbi:hypothetical protein OG788_07660 [Streptomyces sp. NBC_00647]|uniref:hypothetical protein n=1 Tax=Streptomyces sp. NBC_00647 TaxID=2975796 RepID=UPI0032444F86